MITVHDKSFKLYMPEAEIKAVVDEVAQRISHDLRTRILFSVPP